jgi:hypothetical protein
MPTRKILLPRSNQPISAIPDVKAIAVLINDPDVAGPQTIRRSARRLGPKLPPSAGFAQELNIRGLTPGYLASASFLGLDSSGRGYSVAREIDLESFTIKTLANTRRIYAPLIQLAPDIAYSRDTWNQFLGWRIQSGASCLISAELIDIRNSAEPILPIIYFWTMEPDIAIEPYRLKNERQR